MNPFTKLELSIKKLEADLSASQVEALRLRQRNADLVNETITLENSLEQAKDAVSQLCDLCSMQGRQTCRECPLWAFATDNQLWKEA